MLLSRHDFSALSIRCSCFTAFSAAPLLDESYVAPSSSVICSGSCSSTRAVFIVSFKTLTIAFSLSVLRARRECPNHRVTSTSRATA